MATTNRHKLNALYTEPQTGPLGAPAPSRFGVYSSSGRTVRVRDASGCCFAADGQHFHVVASVRLTLPSLDDGELEARL